MAKKHQTERDRWLPGRLRADLQAAGETQTSLADYLPRRGDSLSASSSNKRKVQRLLNGEASFTDEVCDAIFTLIQRGWDEPDKLVELEKQRAFQGNNSADCELCTNLNDRVEGLQQLLEGIHHNFADLKIRVSDIGKDLRELASVVHSIANLQLKVSYAQQRNSSQQVEPTQSGPAPLSIADTAAVLNPARFAWMYGGWVSHSSVREALLRLKTDMRIDRRDFRTLIKNRYFSESLTADCGITVEADWRRKIPFHGTFVVLAAFVSYFAYSVFASELSPVQAGLALGVSSAVVRGIVLIGERFDRLDEVIDQWSGPIAARLGVG